MRKPRIFIASSTESLDVADAFNVNLDHQAEVTVWKHGFTLSQTSIESLLKLAESVDFAIFIFTPDDIALIKGKEKQITRDNVIYELGLFSGTLGKERCFIVKPRETDLHLPSDLLGLTPADYDGNRSDGNLEAAVNHPCTLIKRSISQLGLISSDADATKKPRKKVNYQYKIGDLEHQILVQIMDRHTVSPDGISTNYIFDKIKNGSRASLGLAAIKLERLGYISKSIAVDEYHEFYTFSMSTEGIDYMLANEELIENSVQKSATKTDLKLISKPDDFDDDFPF